jgi:4-diphosphocytidyl-2-C-methyl-D-erythritol kinase
MVSLSLADELELRHDAEGLEVVVEGTARAGLEVAAGASNLVARALELVGRQAQVRLHKRIPAGAGLGGGSSDAAAVLRWAGVRPDQSGLTLAAGLGADVPFCLVGGRARVTGIGEVVEPLEPEDIGFTLLLVPFGVPTAEVYRRWDSMGGPEGEAGNDLESAAVEVEPRLRLWRDAFGEAAGATPHLAGSGSTWFVEGEHPELAGPFEVAGGEPPALVVTARATYPPGAAIALP